MLCFYTLQLLLRPPPLGDGEAPVKSYRVYRNGRVIGTTGESQSGAQLVTWHAEDMLKMLRNHMICWVIWCYLLWIIFFLSLDVFYHETSNHEHAQDISTVIGKQNFRALRSGIPDLTRNLSWNLRESSSCNTHVLRKCQYEDINLFAFTDYEYSVSVPWRECHVSCQKLFDAISAMKQRSTRLFTPFIQVPCSTEICQVQLMVPWWSPFQALNRQDVAGPLSEAVNVKTKLPGLPSAPRTTALCLGINELYKLYTFLDNFYFVYVCYIWFCTFLNFVRFENKWHQNTTW